MNGKYISCTLLRCNTKAFFFGRSTLYRAPRDGHSVLGVYFHEHLLAADLILHGAEIHFELLQMAYPIKLQEPEKKVEHQDARTACKPPPRKHPEYRKIHCEVEREKPPLYSEKIPKSQRYILPLGEGKLFCAHNHGERLREQKALLFHPRKQQNNILHEHQAHEVLFFLNDSVLNA